MYNMYIIGTICTHVQYTQVTPFKAARIIHTELKLMTTQLFGVSFKLVHFRRQALYNFFIIPSQ